MPESEYSLIKEELDVLQADVDDESPQVLGALIDRALEEGALDAHLSPLYMKKNRPGTRVEILCRPADREKFLRLLLTETTTLGVKARRVDRYSLPRRMEEVTVKGHRIRIKTALLDNHPLRSTPEFEDCRAAAKALGVPVRDVLEEVRGMAGERGRVR